MNTWAIVAATVGNHEFNYGPAVFNKYQGEADFPLLSANVTGCRDYTFEPYIIKDVDGVQVGILGLTPPAVVHWERPENIVGCVFGDAMDCRQHVCTRDARQRARMSSSWLPTPAWMRPTAMAARRTSPSSWPMKSRVSM